MKEGTNNLYYTGSIFIDQMTMPDTAYVGDTVAINVKGGAPNGCWSNLELFFDEQSDSLYVISGVGTFASTNGICNDIYLNVDSTFTIQPTKPGKYLFIASLPEGESIKDSIIVVNAPQNK